MPFPRTGFSLIAVVFLLGAEARPGPRSPRRDPMGSRASTPPARPRLSRLVGVVVLGGPRRRRDDRWRWLVATVATEWRAPAVARACGHLDLDRVPLTLLGVANLATVLRTPRGRVVQGRSAFAAASSARLTRAEHPVVIAAVGAAFALSFDTTISQAVLFSITGSNPRRLDVRGLARHRVHRRDDGHRCAERLWVSHLVRSADRTAAAAAQRDEPCDRLHVARDRRARRGAPLAAVARRKRSRAGASRSAPR